MTRVSENHDEARVTSVAPEPELGTAPETSPTREPEASPAPAARPTKTVARSTLRRAPRFGRFILAGIVAAALLAALAAAVSQPLPYLGRGGVFLIVFVGLGVAGAAIGSLLAVLADRRSLKPSAGPEAHVGSAVEPPRGE